MNKNIFYLFELSLSIFVFIFAVSLVFSWHGRLSQTIYDMEKASIYENKILQSNINGLYVESRNTNFVDEHFVEKMLYSSIISENKKKDSDLNYLNHFSTQESVRIWLDFENRYADEIVEIINVPKGEYVIDYDYNSNYEITKIIIKRR